MSTDFYWRADGQHVGTLSAPDVQGASSFTWAVAPEDALRRCNDHLFGAVIIDEYGREYAGLQFLWMLDTSCGLQLGRA